jgi:DnaD/phage-associated family protein
VLVGLLDYLSLDAEYLVLLCAHCADLGKKSLHYMEKVAFDMVDGGVSDVTALQETLRREDAMREAEGKIRTLFGAGGRKLTQAERKYIHHWVEEWKFDMAMIERAYEATVDSIGEASMRYTDGVLKRWYTEGLMTPEAVEASDEKWRQEHEAGATPGNKSGKKGKKDGGESGGSFDTDDFFDAARRRAFEEI